MTFNPGPVASGSGTWSPPPKTPGGPKPRNCLSYALCEDESKNPYWIEPDPNEAGQGLGDIMSHHGCYQVCCTYPGQACIHAGGHQLVYTYSKRGVLIHAGGEPDAEPTPGGSGGLTSKKKA